MTHLNNRSPFSRFLALIVFRLDASPIHRIRVSLRAQLIIVSFRTHLDSELLYPSTNNEWNRRTAQEEGIHDRLLVELSVTSRCVA